jgi:Tol biopolymer transport system component
MRTLSILALSAAALGAAAGASASFPGSAGRLAYFYAAELWSLSPDGAETRPLGAGLSPAWSPNGRLIAFDAIVNGNNDVWVMRADGTGRRRITRNAAPDYFAGWSPDGSQLVFTSDRGGEDLFRIRLDGTGEQRLTDDPRPDWGAAWSPDGRSIAFAGNARGNLEIELIDSAGGGRRQLTDHPERDYDPAWSPDGTKIAFTTERDGNANVYVMNADGTDMSRLTDDPSGDWRPAWSPDGTQIAFESERDEATFDRDVFVMNADGSAQRRLRTGNVNARDVDWQPVIDLTLALRRSGRTIVAEVRNVSSAPALRVRLNVRVGGRRRVHMLGTLAAGATVSRRIAARRASALVSAWQIDPNPRDNGAAVSS